MVLGYESFKEKKVYSVRIDLKIFSQHKSTSFSISLFGHAGYVLLSCISLF